MDEAKPGKLCTSSTTRVAPGADGCKTGEAVKVGTLTRSSTQQTPHLAQPDNFPSLSRDRTIFADDCADSSWCRPATRRPHRLVLGENRHGRACGTCAELPWAQSISGILASLATMSGARNASPQRRASVRAQRRRRVTRCPQAAGYAGNGSARPSLKGLRENAALASPGSSAS